MHDLELSIKEISKVEGKAGLTVSIHNNKVEKVELRVTEARRYYEEMIKGISYKEIPTILSRICGICSPAHLMAAIEATERAFRVEASEQSVLMRNIILNGAFIRSHITHLYLLTLPDYLKRESVLDFSPKEHEHIRRALKLKLLGDNIIRTFGGRAVHPVSAFPGGFNYVPSKEQISELLKELYSAREDAVKTIKLYNSFLYVCENPTNYVALVNENYVFLRGRIESTSGLIIKEKDYLKHLKEFVVPYSTAKKAEFEGKRFFVGALSRMNLNQKNLRKETQKEIKKLGVKVKCFSPFSNNLAQTIEVLHCIDSCISLLEENKFRREPMEKVVPREAEGIGVIEAPRGTLYHQIEFNKQGKATNANIVIPTAQNISNCENDIKVYVSSLLKSKSKKEIEFELEKLIRSYDPCFQCSAHFLKVKWKQK